MTLYGLAAKGALKYLEGGPQLIVGRTLYSSQEEAEANIPAFRAKVLESGADTLLSELDPNPKSLKILVLDFEYQEIKHD